MEVISLQYGCPAITISRNNGNWKMSFLMTPSAFNHCSQGAEEKKIKKNKKSNFYTLSISWNIIFCGRFHPENIWSVSKYTVSLYSQLPGQKKPPRNGSFKQLAFSARCWNTVVLTEWGKAWLVMIPLGLHSLKIFRINSLLLFWMLS